MSEVFRLENIGFLYPGYDGSPDVVALHNVDLTVEKGSFTVILGHNGSGKSTLARILCMLNMPGEGRIYINGNEINTSDPDDKEIIELRKNVGIVFQNPDNQLVATIVEEDVAFGCENLGIPSDEIRRRVDEALEIVGMTEYARHSPYKLSGGQKQRVAIAGTIAMKRDVIVFDESTAMLDPMGREEVLGIIKKLNREDGITVILITHYMEEAVLADKVIVMDHGTVYRQGTPAEIFGDPESLWKVRLDIPQTTELLYKLRQKGLDVRLDVFRPEEVAAEIRRAAGMDNGDR